MDDPLLHAPACPVGRPVGRRRLDVRPDYGAFPVSGWFTLPPRAGRPAREVHGQLNARHLGLTDELATALQSWADWHNEHHPGPELQRADSATPATDDEWQSWNDHGRKLAAQLADQTGAVVVYRWSPGARHCPHPASPS